MTTTTVQSGDAGSTTTRTTATKAWVAAVLSALLAFLSSVATALGGAETGFGSITPGQWVTAVIAAIVVMTATAVVIAIVGAALTPIVLTAVVESRRKNRTGHGR